jgi:hypothetical protein
MSATSRCFCFRKKPDLRPAPLKRCSPGYPPGLLTFQRIFGYDAIPGFGLHLSKNFDRTNYCSQCIQNKVIIGMEISIPVSFRSESDV